MQKPWPIVSDKAGGGALRDLYENYREELVVFIRGKVGGGPPEAEDVTQQAFANYAALKEPQSIKNPRAFLYRTANNILINHLRHNGYSRAHIASERHQNEIFGDCDELSPEIVLLEKERFAVVLSAVKRMKRRRRRFLLLHRLQGLSYCEIARRVGVSEATVRREVEAAVNLCAEALLADGAKKGDD